MSIKIQRYNKSKFKDTKTFDGISDNKIFQCKYIKMSGGSQDNQFNDLIKFNIEQDKYINYLVISGAYGIEQMNKYLKTHSLSKNTNLIILSDSLKIISNKTTEALMTTNLNIQKHYNKYYSTNSELIYEINLIKLFEQINESFDIVEPFVGDCDLLRLLESQLIECQTKYINSLNVYDITNINQLNETQIKNITYNPNIDTLLNSVINSQSFVITNPPYTAKNKLSQETKQLYKQIFDLHPYIQDLYQIFIQQLIDSNVKGGFIIIPSNFMFGKQSKPIRQLFLKSFSIIVLNIFEKKVFEDTTQSTISLLFVNKSINNFLSIQPQIYLHRNEQIIEISNDEFNEILNYSLDELYKHSRHNIKVCRNYNINTKEFKVSNIKISLLDPNIKAYIDSNNKNIQDKITDRAFMRLCFTKQFTEEQEQDICSLFEEHIKNIRDTTHSLVLTSYREYSRKKLSFEEVYTIIEYIINEEI